MSLHALNYVACRLSVLMSFILLFAVEHFLLNRKKTYNDAYRRKTDNSADGCIEQNESASVVLKRQYHDPNHIHNVNYSDEALSKDLVSRHMKIR